ncbi:ALQxL family class IV lanthipeptide [Kitasatospora azatica]|nr:ALQxL family class IV lanthipeptide [Kitasatospora azatica]
MEFDLDALQELVSQEDQAVGACEWSCTRSCQVTVCPATCPVTTV